MPCYSVPPGSHTGANSRAISRAKPGAGTISVSRAKTRSGAGTIPVSGSNAGTESRPISRAHRTISKSRAVSVSGPVSVYRAVSRSESGTGVKTDARSDARVSDFRGLERLVSIFLHGHTFLSICDNT